MARTPSSPPLPAPVPMVQPVAPMPAAMEQPLPRLMEAIIAASANFPDFYTDAENPHFKNKYMKLPSLLKAIKTPLLEQRITIYTQVMPHETTGAWVVRTYLSFINGSEEVYSDFLVCDCSSMHKFSAHIKYGIRHNLFALLAICPEDDDDGGGSGSSAAVAVPVAALPGLPGAAQMPGAWPMPGQVVQAPPAMYQQAPAPPAMYQQAPAPAAMAYPVQPLPVLP